MLRNIARRCLLVILILALMQLNEALSKTCEKGEIGSRNCSADNCYRCTISDLDDYSRIPSDANALQISFSSEAGLELSSRLPLLSRIHEIDVSVSNLGQTPTIPSGYFWGCASLRILTFYTTSPVEVHLVNGSFAGLSNLTKLTASGVGIRELPIGVFTDLRSLKILDLIKNGIMTIENGTFDRQRELNTLYLGANSISSLVNVSFAGLDSLRVIDLYQNKIRVLGSEMAFAPLTNLTDQLNLAENGMLRIDPNAFTGLRRLKKLYLDGNYLSAIAVDVFSDLTQLKELELGRNRLKNLSNGSFSHLKSLEKLNLRANRLDTIVSGAFYGLANLKTLDLSSNLIKTVEEKGFDGLESLTDLELSDNMINVLTFSDVLFLPSLERLDLRNNSLETLSLRTESNIEKLSLLHVDLSQNSWNCDCDIYWVVLLLKHRNLTNSIANSGSTTCSSPSALRNVSILSAYANHSCPYPFQSKQLATPTTELYTPVPAPTSKPYTPVPTPAPKPHNSVTAAAVSNEYNKAKPSRNWKFVAIVGSVLFGFAAIVVISVFVCSRRRRCGFWDRQRSESVDTSLREKVNSKYTLNEELTPRPKPDGSYDNPLTIKDSDVKIVTCTEHD